MTVLEISELLQGIPAGEGEREIRRTRRAFGVPRSGLRQGR